MGLSVPEAGKPSIYSINIELLRFYGYLGFWITVIMGIFLTRVFSDKPADDETILYKVFGFNNICVNFDYAPSTYVLPAFWACTLIVWMFYFAAVFLRLNASVAAGHLDKNSYRWIRFFYFFTACSFTYFSMIFAIVPEIRNIVVNNTIVGNDGGYNNHIYIHTTPFFCLQIAVFFLALGGVMDGLRSGYWDHLDVPRWFYPGAYVYLVCLAITVCFKIPYALNAMQGPPGTGDRWWENTPTLDSIGAFFDSTFLFLGAFLPLMKTVYLLWFKSDKLDRLHLTTAHHDHQWGVVNAMKK
uniref:Uncharacterized protein n=1 Tax=Aplanochytrium stocchinoi TaxID=215587 RepID=A0A7S3PBZ0_9STRA